MKATLATLVLFVAWLLSSLSPTLDWLDVAVVFVDEAADVDDDPANNDDGDQDLDTHQRRRYSWAPWY